MADAVPARDPELRERALDMVPRGEEPNAEALGDLVVGEPFGDETRHLNLARGQPVLRV